jgi:hypothetical protein
LPRSTAWYCMMSAEADLSSGNDRERTCAARRGHRRHRF